MMCASRLTGCYFLQEDAVVKYICVYLVRGFQPISAHFWPFSAGNHDWMVGVGGGVVRTNEAEIDVASEVRGEAGGGGGRPDGCATGKTLRRKRE